MAITDEQKSSAVEQGVGGGQPFSGIFRDAFRRDLKQQDPNFTGIDQRATDTTRQLANMFVDEYATKTGQLPSADQIHHFLGASIDTGLAAKALSSGISDLEVRSQIAGPAVSSLLESQRLAANDASLANGQNDFEKLARDTAQERRALVGTLSDLDIQRGGEDINRQFGDTRRGLIEEDAALGRLRQPVSSIRTGQLDAQRNKAFSDLVREVRGSQLGKESDIQGESLNQINQGRQFGANLGLQTSQLGENRRQFNQNFSEQMRQFNDTQRNDRLKFQDELDASDRLGKLQAEASKPGILDYVNTGFNGLAALGGAVGGVGSAGGISGLMSKFRGSKGGTPAGTVAGAK